MTQDEKPAVKIPALFRKIQPWDDKWLLRLNAKAGSKFTRFVELSSFLGRFAFWILVMAAFVFVWYDPLAAIWIGLNIGFGLAIVYVIKIFVRRPRPFRGTPGVKVLEGPNLSASFPSWHAYNGMAGVLALYVIFNYEWIFLLVGIPFAICLGLTRPFLGVHYVTDVIAGWIFGVLGFAACFLITPLLVPFIGQLEALVPWPLVRGTWGPFVGQWWFWILLGGAALVFLYVTVYRRKKRKSKVEWR